MQKMTWETIPLPREHLQLVVVVWECTRCHSRVSSVFTGRVEPSETYKFVRCHECDKPYRITLPTVLVESFWPHAEVTPTPAPDPPLEVNQPPDEQSHDEAQEHQNG